MFFNVFGMDFHVSIWQISVIHVNDLRLVVLSILWRMMDYLEDIYKKTCHDLLNGQENYLIDEIMMVQKLSFIPDTFTPDHYEGDLRYLWRSAASQEYYPVLKLIFNK